MSEREDYPDKQVSSVPESAKGGEPKLRKISDEELNQILKENKVYSLSLGGQGKRANLSGVDLSGKNLTEAKLEYARLKGANLEGARLKGADLSKAKLIAVNLRKADLSKADLSYANLEGARLKEADLRGANLEYARLKNVDLREAKCGGTRLRRADLSNANLDSVNLTSSNFYMARLRGTNLRGANLSYANLIEADLKKADLCEADLSWSNLTNADFDQANLSKTNLTGASLLWTKIRGTNLSNSRVHGTAAWSLKISPKTRQLNLVITHSNEPIITVDNIEVAQFVYLLLNNEKIRDVINTIGERGVLILGRFIEERKAVLDAIREKLRELGFVPMMFDFEKPTQRDFTETIKTLAGMSRFIIADITNPKSSPLELQAIMPDYMIPFVPIIHEREKPFSMFRDLNQKYGKWVLDVSEYDSAEGLIDVLDEAVVQPALKKAYELIDLKAEDLKKRHVKDYKK